MEISLEMEVINKYVDLGFEEGILTDVVGYKFSRVLRDIQFIR